MFLFVVAAVRIVIMLFPQNNWESPLPSQPWATYRNLPFMLQGLGVAYLIIRDAKAVKDKAFKWMGVMILVSYVL